MTDLSVSSAEQEKSRRKTGLTGRWLILFWTFSICDFHRTKTWNYTTGVHSHQSSALLQGKFCPMSHITSIAPVSSTGTESSQIYHLLLLSPLIYSTSIYSLRPQNKALFLPLSLSNLPLLHSSLFRKHYHQHRVAQASYFKTTSSSCFFLLLPIPHSLGDC